MSNSSDQPNAFTCGVCGKPILPLMQMPMPGGAGGTNLCVGCNSVVCAKDYSRSRRLCVRCFKQSDSWCRVPGGKA